MKSSNFFVLLFMLALLGSSLAITVDFGDFTVSAAPLSPYIQVVPEQTVNSTITLGMNYTIAIYTDYEGSDIWSWQFDLTFNPAVLEGIEVRNGDLITQAEFPDYGFQWGSFDNVNGELSPSTVYTFLLPPGSAATGPGTFAYVTFKVVGAGISSITLGSTTSLILYVPDPTSFPELINASLPPGATQPPYGSDHIGHGSFNNIPPIHDVAVTKVVPPASAILGQNVTIDVTVANQGNFTETFDVALEANLTEIGTQSVTNLASADSAMLPFVWNTAGLIAGNYTLNATVSLADDDISNNNKTATMEIREVHDVAIISLQAPTEAAIGDTVRINVTVANQGSFDENINLTITYESQIAGQTLPSDTVLFSLAKLPASQTVQVNWATSGILKGGYNITATANITQDEDLTDNTRSQLIQMYVGHDVSISFSATSYNVLAGENVTIGVTVRNIGGFDENNIEVKITYDSNTIGSQLISSLPEGGTTTLTFDWNTAGVTPRFYTITGEAILETDINPTNNQRQVGITVIPTKGHISGTVTDASENPVQGANVTANGHFDITDANGQYNITDLSPATYTVTVSKNGYETESRTDIVVTAGHITSVNFSLTPEQTSDNMPIIIAAIAVASLVIIVGVVIFLRNRRKRGSN